MIWCKRKTTILVVCTANVTRSAFFAALLAKKLDEAVTLKGRRFAVRSCGVAAQEGASAHMVVRLLAQQHGLDLRHHRSRPCTRALVRKADIVLTMETSHKREVLEWFPDAKDKVFTVMEFGWVSDEAPADIPDPTGMEVEDYRTFVDVALREADRIVYELIHREWS